MFKPEIIFVVILRPRVADRQNRLSIVIGTVERCEKRDRVRNVHRIIHLLPIRFEGKKNSRITIPVNRYKFYFSFLLSSILQQNTLVRFNATPSSRSSSTRY